MADASAKPWLLWNDKPYVFEVYPLVFGSCFPTLYIIDETEKSGTLDVCSLSFGYWPEPDENGNRLFKVTIQEEYGNMHFVCNARILVDSNYKFISETLHDKYNDNFEIGWSGCYSMLRYLAGCVDWNDPLAAGVEENAGVPQDAGIARGKH